MNRPILSAFADEIDSSLITQMNVLDKHDIKYIEMRGVNGKNLVDHTLDEVRDIKRQLASKNFKISAIGSPIGKIMITDDFDAHFELFKHTLNIAKILETRYIRIFSFFIPENTAPEIYRETVMSRMKKLTEAAETQNITLLHENEKDIYGDIPERCLDIFETVNSKFLRATFDPANFVQCGVEPYPHAYRLLENQIEYLHMKDALFRDNSVVPAGEGDGNITEILNTLISGGYKGFISLEPHLASFEGFQNLEPHSKTPMGFQSDGERKFAIAADALNKILEKVTKET